MCQSGNLALHLHPCEAKLFMAVQLLCLLGGTTLSSFH